MVARRDRWRATAIVVVMVGVIVLVYLDPVMAVGLVVAPKVVQALDRHILARYFR